MLKIDEHLYFDIELTLLQKALISQRICTIEAGSNIYPSSEACFMSIEQWERATNRDFFVEFAALYKASWGAA